MSLVTHMCAKCGLDVPPGSGSLTVDVVAAMRFAKARDVYAAEQALRTNSWGERISLEPYLRAESDQPAHVRFARWLPLHNDCFPEFDAHLYGIPMGDIATLEGYMSSTQHLASKKWFRATDWHNYWLQRVLERKASRQQTKDDIPYIVYRAYGDRDELLYVGITYHFARRKAQHKRDSRWFSLAVRWETETYENRAVAREAERHVIATEIPLFNEEGATV